jgi:hypothetical protein
MITRTPPLLRTLFLSLATLFLASPVQGGNTFNARIIITSQCSAQHALFGPQAQQGATITCLPGSTPFQTQAISLGSNAVNMDQSESKDSSELKTGADSGQQSQSATSGAITSSNSTKTILSPPLPTSSAFASKVVYVVF